MLTIQGKTYITTTEAAKLTGYTAGHIQRLVKQNKIEAKKIGKIWAVCKDSVIEFGELDKGQKQPSKVQKIEGLKMYQKAFVLGHKMRKSLDGRVYCIHCQETITNISKGNLSCKKQ